MHTVNANSSSSYVATVINANMEHSSQIALDHALSVGMARPAHSGDVNSTPLQMAAKPYLLALKVLLELKQNNAMFYRKPLVDEVQRQQALALAEVE